MNVNKSEPCYLNYSPFMMDKKMPPANSDFIWRRP